MKVFAFSSGCLTLQKLNRFLWLIIFALGSSLGCTQAFAQNPNISQEVVDEANRSFIFVLRSDFPVQEISQHAQYKTQQHGARLRHTFTKALKGFSATISQQAAQQLIDHDPNILYAEANGVVWAINQPVTKSGKSTTTTIDEPTQVIPPGILRVGGPLDGTGRNAWVIDTGIDTKHPDLQVGYGANFVLRGKNTVEDGNGHGTHVAGTIAAKNNNIDVVGVAANATVHPIRVLDNNGSGTIDSVVAGINYVASHAQPMDAANMSLGAAGHFQSLHDAVLNAASLGIRFAIAAGNSSSDASGFEPAHIEHPNIYTVSAIDASDVFASFSNFGPPVDFAAPGVNILSTKKGGGVTTMSGTSMATPHVCGLLLFGTPNSSGTAKNDPDGNPDPIAHN